MGNNKYAQRRIEEYGIERSLNLTDEHAMFLNELETFKENTTKILQEFDDKLKPLHGYPGNREILDKLQEDVIQTSAELGEIWESTMISRKEEITITEREEIVQQVHVESLQRALQQLQYILYRPELEHILLDLILEFHSNGGYTKREPGEKIESLKPPLKAPPVPKSKKGKKKDKKEKKSGKASAASPNSTRPPSPPPPTEDNVSLESWQVPEKYELGLDKGDKKLKSIRYHLENLKEIVDRERMESDTKLLSLSAVSFTIETNKTETDLTSETEDANIYKYKEDVEPWYELYKPKLNILIEPVNLENCLENVFENLKRSFQELHVVIKSEADVYDRALDCWLKTWKLNVTKIMKLYTNNQNLPIKKENQLQQNKPTMKKETEYATSPRNVNNRKFKNSTKSHSTLNSETRSSPLSTPRSEPQSARCSRKPSQIPIPTKCKGSASTKRSESPTHSPEKENSKCEKSASGIIRTLSGHELVLTPSLEFEIEKTEVDEKDEDVVLSKLLDETNEHILLESTPSDEKVRKYLTKYQHRYELDDANEYDSDPSDMEWDRKPKCKVTQSHIDSRHVCPVLPSARRNSCHQFHSKHVNPRCRHSNVNIEQINKRPDYRSIYAEPSKPSRSEIREDDLCRGFECDVTKRCFGESASVLVETSEHELLYRTKDNRENESYYNYLLMSDTDGKNDDTIYDENSMCHNEPITSYKHSNHNIYVGGKNDDCDLLKDVPNKVHNRRQRDNCHKANSYERYTCMKYNCGGNHLLNDDQHTKYYNDSDNILKDIKEQKNENYSNDSLKDNKNKPDREQIDTLNENIKETHCDREEIFKEAQKCLDLLMEDVKSKKRERETTQKIKTRARSEKIIGSFLKWTTHIIQVLVFTRIWPGENVETSTLQKLQWKVGSTKYKRHTRFNHC